MKRACQTLALIVLAATGYASGDARGAEDIDPRIRLAIQTAQNRQASDPTDALNFLAGEVVKAAAAEPDERAEMERRMIDGLRGAQTRAARDFFCRQLVLIGSPAAVPELAKLLPNRESSHIARYALARIAGPEVDAALLAALDQVDDLIKIGVVHSLGTRNCQAAVEPIRALLAHANQDLASAAWTALGRIDSDAACGAIASARRAAADSLKSVAADAYLACAARLLKQGRSAAALAIYRELFAPDEPPLVRVAALNGLIAAQQEQATAVAIAALDDKDAEVRRVAVPALRSVPGESATRAIMAEVSRHGDEVGARLLGVLADRNDPLALPAVIQATDAAGPLVRTAALNALATLGDAAVAPLLLQRAADTAQADEQQAARGSLRLLAGDGVDAAIAAQLSAVDPAVQTEAARALAARGATDQLAALLAAAKAAPPAVASEAFKAVRGLAKSADAPAIARLLIEARDDAVRSEAENALVAAATTDAGPNPAETVLGCLPAATTAEAQASLLRVLGRIAHPSALSVLYQAVSAAEPVVKDAAIRALAEWPTAEPVRVLRDIASDSAQTQVHRVLALRAHVGMISKQPDATDDEILDDYAQAARLALRNEERELVLSRLGLIRHRRALQMAREQAEDPALKAAADAAVQSIERLFAAPVRVSAWPNPDKAANAVDKDPETRWDTGRVQQGGEWFRIELDEDSLIKGLVLDTSGSGGDYPRGYEVYVSRGVTGDGKRILVGQGDGPITKIVFPEPIRARAIKIIQTGSTAGLYWSIHELTVDAQPVAP